MKTVFDSDFKLQDSDLTFNYQKELTEWLDNFEGDFSQELVNEIVLWKGEKVFATGFSSSRTSEQSRSQLAINR
jgi:hypothetical protein